MSRAWYILQTYSQYENKVQDAINQLVADGSLAEAVFDIKVPTEKVHEIKNGKKVEKEVKLYPGYVLVEMDLPNQGWKEVIGPIKRINGVSGFVGSVGNVKPRPIPNDEVKKILLRSGDIKGDKSILITQDFKEGQEVRIIGGAFESFTGTIENVNLEKQRLKVVVGIFGRATPVELEFTQVEKV